MGGLNRLIWTALFSVLAVLAAQALPARAGDAAAQQLRFESFRVPDGLSSSSVSGITQDGPGFLWFATQAGLDRYDGVHVRRYENVPFDGSSLVHNQVQTIYRDTDGSLWIGTYGGLSHYLPGSDSFRSFVKDPTEPDSLSNNVVVSIARDSRGNLWVGTLDGLNRLNAATGTFTIYRATPDDSHALPNSVIRSILTDREGRLWIGTYAGLSLYHPDSDTFTTVSPSTGVDMGSTNVMTILEDPEEDGVLWLGTWGGGECRYDTRDGSAVLTGLADDRVYTSLIDSENRLWVGTWGGGLFLVPRQGGRAVRYVAGDAESIPNDTVYSLYEDTSSVLWIGTNGGGVTKVVDSHSQYGYFRHDDRNPGSLPAGRITAMLEDSEGREWYGVYNAGVHRLNADGVSFTHYRHDGNNPASISDDMVNQISQDSRGRIWIASNGGLDLFDPKTGEFTHPYAGGSPMPLDGKVIDCYLEDSSGAIWIGTYVNGVYRYDPKSKTYVHFSTDEPDSRRLPDNLVRVIYEDSERNIWIGTNNGVARYGAGPRLVSFTPGTAGRDVLSHGNVQAIVEGTDGRIYIATKGGGVNIYKPETGEFEYLTTRNGLASNIVSAIVVERPNTYYFSTQVGLSVYHADDGSFQTVDASNGLLSNELTNASMRDASGVLHIGSTAGVTLIPRVEPTLNDSVPNVVLTGLHVMGKDISPGTPSSGTYPAITLPFRYNNFSADFAVLDYANPDRNILSYELVGLDTDWHRAGDQRYVNYSSLPPGHYRLRVVGAGSLGNWNRTGISLPVHVVAPWWRTPYAYVAYSVGLLLLVLGFAALNRLRHEQHTSELRRQAALNQELEVRVRERTAEIEHARMTAEDATHAKSVFMAKMSHEIRTPLNGIGGMLSLLRETELTPQQRKYLDYTQAASENLQHLVNDVLDLERIKAGRYAIENAPFALRESVESVVETYRPQAAEKGLSIAFDIDPEVPNAVIGDRTRFSQVVTNLMSNALRYTERGTIAVRLSTFPVDSAGVGRVAGVRTSVADTGVGIAPEMMGTLFDRFSQTDSKQVAATRGTGLGLSIVKQLTTLMGGRIYVESEAGRGSKFTVEIPFTVVTEKSQAESGESASDSRGADRPSNVPGGGVARSGVDPGARSMAEVRADSSPAAANPFRVLIAEDEAINSLFLQSILEARKIEVAAVDNGRDAVARVRDGSYDVVLMDVGMPEMSGLEAATAIRAFEAEDGRERVPIIALTAYAFKSDIDDCLAAGMDDFVSKPLNQQVLFQKIERWTRR